MRLMAGCMLFGLIAGAGVANAPPKIDRPPLKAIEWAANAIFPDMPRIVKTTKIERMCGADEHVNPDVAYCTTTNVIFVNFTVGHTAADTYKLAHVYGHAAQVRHGVADVALRAIRARPDEEDKLRGWVTRQVECIAGFIHARADLPRYALQAVFDEEPMVDAHWGRDPLHLGPVVSIGLAARAEWFGRGYDDGLEACSVEEFGADLLLDAAKPFRGSVFR